jgi:hypothetical protein
MHEGQAVEMSAGRATVPPRGGLRPVQMFLVNCRLALGMRVLEVDCDGRPV